VPIIGGPSGKLESRYHVNTLTYGAAAKLKGNHTWQISRHCWKTR
jgi:DNA-binding transcriptional regulator LsrR (DeoR family)